MKSNKVVKVKKTVITEEEFRCCDICGCKLSYQDTYNVETCKECGKDICSQHRIAVVAFKVLLNDNICSIADMEAFEKHEPIAYRMLCKSCFEDKFKETLDPKKFQWAAYGGGLIPKFKRLSCVSNCDICDSANKGSD